MSDRIPVSPEKVCVVVGVGEGLGAALARRFAADYKVALIARSAEVIGKVGGAIKDAGGVALPIQSDATVESQIASAHEQISRELGPVEILIFNGGRRPIGRLLETTPEVFEQTWRLQQRIFGHTIARNAVTLPDRLAGSSPRGEGQMKASRFSEEQIIAVLREHEAGRLGGLQISIDSHRQ
jgi:NAD(P)-dependent dehydrogenase (short-subunit alcohol dehydrogenase family)